MLPECIPQTGQVLPNYPDRRLRRIRIIIYTDEGENSIDHIDENAHHAVSDIHLILCMACFLLCHCFASLPQHTAAISSDKALAANLPGDEVCCTQENDAYNTLQHADCC